MAGCVENEVIQSVLEVVGHLLDGLIGIGGDDPAPGDLLDGQFVGEALHLHRVGHTVLLLRGQ